MSILRIVEKQKLAKREAVVADLADGFTLYSEIGKAWILKAIKHPLISMVRDEDLDLNFLDNAQNRSVPIEEKRNRLMKAKVRLRGILKGLLEQSTADTVPMPLISFLANAVKSDQFVPDGFLSQFELGRVQLDACGALQKVSDKQTQMMVGNYILIKILVSQMLGNPQSLGILPDEEKEKKKLPSG